MPNTALGGKAFCPFYMRDNFPHEFKIKCMDPEGGESAINEFSSRKEKKEYSKEFCESKNCTKCDKYKSFIKKYE